MRSVMCLDWITLFGVMSNSIIELKVEDFSEDQLRTMYESDRLIAQ